MSYFCQKLSQKQELIITKDSEKDDITKYLKEKLNISSEEYMPFSSEENKFSYKLCVIK